MNSERPRSEYRCAQGDLYTVCETIAHTYADHVASFMAYSGLYTANTGTDLLAAVASARILPDESQRKVQHSVRRTQLDNERIECLSYWQQLTSYIRDGFKPDQYDDMLQAAGYIHYEAALNGNWDSTRSLMDAANAFVAENTADLTTGGMPAAFATDLSTRAVSFADIHNKFLQAEEAAKVGTDIKITANNKVYKDTMRICEDGKRIFRNNAAIREEFTFDRVLELVRGGVAGHGVSGVVTQASDNAVVGQAKLVLDKLQEDGTYTNVGEMLSANDGTYKFNGVLDGSYRLKAHKLGFVEQEVMVTVAGGPEVVDFELSGED